MSTKGPDIITLPVRCFPPKAVHVKPYPECQRPPTAYLKPPLCPVTPTAAASSGNLPSTDRNTFHRNDKASKMFWFVPHRSEGHIRGFRHRSGSLESQSQLLHSRCSKSVYPLSTSRRSNSTEVLDDCSSYSSMDYCPPCSVTPPYRTLDSHSYDYRSHRNTAIYGNTGSMPNLVPQNSSCYSYQQNHYGPHTYYVTGYPGFDYEPCSNGAYVYESELEGHYNLNPSYPTHGYHGRSRNRHYGMEGSDKLSQNPYATVRPPRGRQGHLNEVLTKNMYKALVAEHLKGWYNRSAGQHRDPGGCHLVYTYKYDRGSQHSLGYQTLPAPFSHSSRTNSFSSGTKLFFTEHSSWTQWIIWADKCQKRVQELIFYKLALCICDQ